MMRLPALWILLLLITAAHGQVVRKVLIIGIDGCRGDALVAANTPNLDGLRNSGYQTLQANTHPPTWSGTGWSTMLSGVWEQKHKVVDNTFANQQFAAWPHFFARLNAVDPTLDLVSVVHWSPINTAITTMADAEINCATDQLVADNAVDQLTNGDPDVLFLQFDDVDHAGHTYGFSPAITNYLTAIELVDQQLGPVLTALQQRPPNEEWLVYVTTDHGGNTAGHGGITFEEQRIFAFVSAPGITPSVQNAVLNTVAMPSTATFAVGRHARLPSNGAYQFGTTQDFTIECRVKMPATWTGDPVFVGDKNWSSGLNKGFVLSTTGAGYNWKFNIGDGVDRVDLTGLPINDGQWHHIAVTCDRDGEVGIFQDGLLLRSASMALIGDVDPGLQLCFGQDGTTMYGVGLTGSLAEVRVWNEALAINTVSEWSGKALTVAHPNSAALIGHWRMNEGSGGIFFNAVPGAPAAQHYTSGILSAATWAASGLQLSCTDLTRTPTQADLVPTVLAHLCIANDPAWELDGKSLIPVCAPVSAQVRTMLDGPFQPSTGSMADSLRVNGLLPLAEPYSALGFEHAGLGGGEQLLPAVLDVAGDDAIVDWVLLEERDGADPTRLLSTRSALLQCDGDIVDVDGTPLIWRALLGSHYVVVRHRNHLGAMTDAPLSFAADQVINADLTSIFQPLYGTDAMRDRVTLRTQWQGNVVPDGFVRYVGGSNDRDPILTAVGGSVPTAVASGYRLEDVNMDGMVKYVGAGNDRDPVLQTVGGSVPTATRIEQLP